MKHRTNQSNPSPWRRRTLLGFWLAISSLICARAIQIQGVQSSHWREIAGKNSIVKIEKSLRREDLSWIVMDYRLLSHKSVS
ncbi:MAG: hypothetical protein Ct9H300mP15_22470 [Gemmatimonadota bacterium]|nr:MAG: hypothetical protein Ct9H300mP15_22470 [Gemmatimonadota bacterium]